MSVVHVCGPIREPSHFFAAQENCVLAMTVRQIESSPLDVDSRHVVVKVRAGFFGTEG
jgi:hypothetical protein